MTTLDDEYVNEPGPIANAGGVLGIWVAAPADQLVHSIDLATVFRNPSTGYYIVQADGGNFYFALHATQIAIDPAATGVTEGACMLMPSGSTSGRFRITAGPHPTVVGTHMMYSTVSYRSTSTGTFRIVRKGLPPPKDAGELYRAPL